MRELLIRGYSQYEISNTLHISQPTISRDIDFVKNETSSASNQDLAHRMCYEQQNGLDGVGELMKNLWLIIDNPKIEVKERIKAMKLMLHCQYMRLKLVDSEAFMKQFYDDADKVKSDEEANTIREQEIASREQALQAYLERKRLTMDEFYKDPKSDRVF